MYNEIAPAYILSGLNRMASYFNKNLNDNQQEEWIEILSKRCPNEQAFNDTIDSIIEVNRYMPTIREFTVAHASIRDKQLKIKGKQPKSDCLLCNGFGAVTCIQNDAEVAMACKCKAGDDVELLRHTREQLRDDPNNELTEKENAIYKALKTYFHVDRTVKELQKRLA